MGSEASHIALFTYCCTLWHILSVCEYLTKICENVVESSHSFIANPSLATVNQVVISTGCTLSTDVLTNRISEGLSG